MRTRDMTLPHAVCKPQELADAAQRVLCAALDEWPKPVPLRLLGVKLSALEDPSTSSRTTLHQFVAKHSSESAECPVCERPMEGSIAEVSAHVEACLSRQTIKRILMEEERAVQARRKKRKRTSKRPVGPLDRYVAHK